MVVNPKNPPKVSLRQFDSYKNLETRKVYDALNPPVLDFIAFQTLGAMVLLLFGLEVPARFRALMFA